MRESVVHLVGAGPGDPELLTLKALRVMREAEIVVHDRLVSAAVLDLVPDQVERVSVGKQAGRHSLRQEEINELLVTLARSGRRIARLKGGDPFTFGRGGEEALHLLRNGIRIEVVPGITSASGCAASLLVPLTHRGLATGVRYVTGHCRDGWWLDVDWAGLADPRTTLVVYMGLAAIDEIASRLIEAGLPAWTPSLAVQDGTTTRERSLRAPLAGLAEAVHAAELHSPVLFVIGAVVDVLAPDALSGEDLTVRTDEVLAQLVGG